MLDWQKNLVSNIIMTFTWSDNSLQTRYKMGARFGISSSSHTIAFNICQVTLVQFINHMQNEDQVWFLKSQRNLR